MRFSTTAVVAAAAWASTTQAVSFCDAPGNKANLTTNATYLAAQPAGGCAILKNLPLYTAGLLANSTTNLTTLDVTALVYIVVNHVDILMNISNADPGLADTWIITTASTSGYTPVHEESYQPVKHHNCSNACSSSVLFVWKWTKSNGTTPTPSIAPHNATSSDDERIKELVHELKHMHLLLRIPLLSLGIISCLLQIVNTTCSIFGTMRRMVHPTKKDEEEPKQIV